ncbi:MAG TPA: sterol desaturase [Microscillaceae bacterium]|nr:sterol desaturase [Microscillaceae bacterium]
METYAKALSYAIPGFTVLILIEYIASRWMKKEVNRGMDTISSLSSGMTNTLKNIMGLSVVILSYQWMHTNFALFEMKASWWVFIVAFIGIDFAAYWSHRFNHKVNLFWNRHIVHHSSEEFNLSCALRQSVSDVIGIYFFLYIPLAFIGVPVIVIAYTAPIHLFAQFWYHTRLIGKMGFLEHIIVTPSHHRVHHAINPEYIDKNLSTIFIIWDKLFGTFQEELDDVPPVYGVIKPVKTWNPVLINFVHLWGLIKDAWRAQSWKDKLRIWYMPTGWRPADVAKKYPIEITENPYAQVKYSTPTSRFFLGWFWAQLVINLALMLFLLANFANIAYLDLMLYGTFLWISIFAYTTTMDKHRLGIGFEGLKFLLGAYLIYKTQGWFGLEAVLPGAAVIVGTYLITSMVLTVAFLRKETIQPVRQMAVN